MYPPGRLRENYEKITRELRSPTHTHRENLWSLHFCRCLDVDVWVRASTFVREFDRKTIPASSEAKRSLLIERKSSFLISRTREYPPALRRPLLAACRTRTVNNYRYRYRNERNWLLRQFQFAEQSEAKWRRTKPREAGKKRLSRWKEIFMSAGSTAFVAVTAGP